jgi:hypothetical protein
VSGVLDYGTGEVADFGCGGVFDVGTEQAVYNDEDGFETGLVSCGVGVGEECG